MAKLLKSVKDLRVLVTGGGSGLGAATAAQLASRGARVMVLDLLDASAVRVPPPRDVAFFKADIAEEQPVAEAMSAADRQLGGLDAVVNCAGQGLAARMYNWNEDSVLKQEDFVSLLRINVVGTFNVCRLAARLMARNGPTVDKADGSQRGVIVNTSSMSAFDGQTTQCCYSASKAAVSAMTLPLARDLAPLGVRVCSIAPGYFKSPMCYRDAYPPKVVKFLADHNRAIYRLGRPDEFADAVEAVLLNPMLNGVNIRLDAASRGFFYNRRKKAVPLVAQEAATAGNRVDPPAAAAGI